MAWRNLLDHPDFDPGAMQIATCGGAGNTLYLSGSMFEPPPGSISNDGDAITVAGEATEAGFGDIDGLLLALPASIAGSPIRVTFLEVDAPSTRFQAYGGAKVSGFTVAAFSPPDDSLVCFSQPNLFLAGRNDGEPQPDDGKSIVDVEDLSSHFRITGINCGDGVMVRDEDLQPGVVEAGNYLGVWIAVSRPAD